MSCYLLCFTIWCVYVNVFKVAHVISSRCVVVGKEQTVCDHCAVLMNGVG